MKRGAVARRASPYSEAGFSLIELIVVVGIISVLAAGAIPAIGTYIRNYTIRGAADQVAGEMQTARLQAIKKNVNYGVVFVVLSQNTYQYFLEDGFAAGARQAYGAADMGPIRTLPSGVRFDNTGANDTGMRFTRLGAICDPGSNPVNCPDLTASGITPAPTGNYVLMDTTNADATLQGAGVSLIQDGTGLQRTVVVTFGGRVRVLNR